MTKNTDNQIHLVIDKDFYNISDFADLDGLIYDVKGLGLNMLRELNPDLVVLVSPASNDSKILTSMKIPHIFLELPSEALHDVEYLYKRLSEIDLTEFRTKPRSSVDTSTDVSKRPPTLSEEELRSMHSERVVNVPDGVEIITGDSFSYNKNNEEIYLPDGVTTIGNYAFYSCRKLKSIRIPDSVEFIGNGVFYGCTSLTSIKLPNNVISIGDKAFDFCENLVSIQYLGVVYTVVYNENGAVLEATTMQPIVDFLRKCIPTKGNAEVTTRTLSADELLALRVQTFVEIPEGITTIEGLAFRGCAQLESITIPNSVVSIGDYAFEYCESIRSITIPDSVTSIGRNAFRGCNKLTSIVIPDSVKYIGDCAFYDCLRLDSIELPNNVISIGDGAFYGCKNLKEIQYLGKMYTVLYKNDVLLEANTEKPIEEFLRECIAAKGNTEVVESVEKLPKRIRVSEEELLKMIKA